MTVVVAKMPLPGSGDAAKAIKVTSGENEYELAEASGDVFAKYLQIIPWVSLDGFTLTEDGAGAVSIYGVEINLVTSTTNGHKTYVQTSGPWSILFEAGKVLIVEFPLMALGYLNTFTVLLHVTRDNTVPPSETQQHLGWKIENLNLFASNGNGSAQTATDTEVNIVPSTQTTLLKLVFTPGTDCKFYVNDVLKATHTTNLPGTGATWYLTFGLTNTAAPFLGNSFMLGRVQVEREI